MTYVLQSDIIASDSEHMAINSTIICEGVDPSTLLPMNLLKVIKLTNFKNSEIWTVLKVNATNT